MDFKKQIMCNRWSQRQTVILYEESSGLFGIECPNYEYKNPTCENCIRSELNALRRRLTEASRAEANRQNTPE